MLNFRTDTEEKKEQRNESTTRPPCLGPTPFSFSFSFAFGRRPSALSDSFQDSGHRSHRLEIAQKLQRLLLWGEIYKVHFLFF